MTSAPAGGTSLTVARHMVAFRKATQTLKRYYENLREAPLSTSTFATPYIFPYPSSYNSLHGEATKRFQYVTELEADKLIFSATEEGGDRICVKFVQAYSLDAHEHLARLGCAPALRGFKKMAGGWSMVVMDRLPDELETLSARNKPLPSSVFADISAKLELFHKAGFVHGDIRDTNIMLSKSDETRFMIVDFEWAGRTGEARYPSCVNYIDIKRPPEARDGKEILADHDIAMLRWIPRLKSYILSPVVPKLWVALESLAIY
ncbi:hypothetical protein BV22DRAFT_1024235 [Leucogyrophana mollusca]|uniref:Uncharacterized protein n=1 Tax=Leucogyrophana mollusca TaxID=85980 RepID=A0ACB8AZE8_9AGAM|nr:hypothetical protein BV22DRAFT_1024235 [Leucogyrophana mollusca]